MCLLVYDRGGCHPVPPLVRLFPGTLVTMLGALSILFLCLTIRNYLEKLVNQSTLSSLLLFLLLSSSSGSAWTPQASQAADSYS